MHNNSIIHICKEKGKRLLNGGRSQIRNAIISVKLARFRRKGKLVPIERIGEKTNEVQDYWTGHTVHDGWFISGRESLQYREHIWDMYPCYREFADMDRDHTGETILDYGCGPGNDLTWYSQRTNPSMIIGMDISNSALKNSQFRMALHGVDKKKCRLIQIDEADAAIPLEDASVDFVNCQGVLMHTSSPQTILKEFCRVLKPANEKNNCCIMVYNKDSIWYHLYAAYYLRFVDSSPLEITLEEAQKLDIDDVFRMSTDGIDCPIARCWSSGEFADIALRAGFSRVLYKGGYCDSLELWIVKDYLQQALNDPRLEDVHKVFLRDVSFDNNGYPVRTIDGRTEMCSLGGVFQLWTK